MGYFKIRGALAIGGGSVQLGADTNIYRKAANQIATDDGIHLAGTVGVVGASTFTAALTTNGGIDSSGGTPFRLPYSTSSPTLDTNGDIRIYHKSAVPYLAFRSGGTSYVLRFPTSDEGTATLRVNVVP